METNNKHYRETGYNHIKVIEKERLEEETNEEEKN